MDNNTRNRIIIIGNGFDLAHGLPTSYRSFIDHLWEDKTNEINRMLAGRNDLTSITDRDELFVVEVEDVSHFSGEKQLKRYITYKNGLLETIEKKRNILNDPKWSDIEDIYYDCLLKCYNQYDAEKEQRKYEDLSIVRLNREFRTLRAKLCEYLHYVNNENDKERKEYRRLVSAMKDIFQSSDGKHDIKKIIFVCFNYTHTLETYDYQVLGETDTNDPEIVYIHGSLDLEDPPKDDSIIFGYGDELDTNSLNIQENKDNAFLEYNKAVLYARSGEYQKIVPYIYGGDDYEVYIMGHSCANSDRALLNEILDNNHCKLIKYFYFDGGAGKEVNFGEQISNLYRIFGEDHQTFRAIFCPLNQSQRLPQIRDEEPQEEASVKQHQLIDDETNEISISGIQFIRIEGGQLYDDVEIDDFWMGKSLVTQEQWQSVMGYNPSHYKGKELPVETITYQTCHLFTAKFGELTGESFSLPTENQWLFVAQNAKGLELDGMHELYWEFVEDKNGVYANTAKAYLGQLSNSESEPTYRLVNPQTYYSSELGFRLVYYPKTKQ